MPAGSKSGQIGACRGLLGGFLKIVLPFLSFFAKNIGIVKIV